METHTSELMIFPHRLDQRSVSQGRLTVVEFLAVQIAIGQVNCGMESKLHDSSTVCTWRKQCVSSPPRQTGDSGLYLGFAQMIP